jgi:hypothetical protein
MKTLIIIILMIPFSATLFAQQDSSKSIINDVVIKGKDMYYIYKYLEKNNRNESIDSVIKVRSRPSAPGNNADVEIDGVEARVWRDIYKFVRNNLLSLQQNVDERVRSALILVNNAWLTHRIDMEDSEVKAPYDIDVDTGKKLAKKEID